MAAVRVPPSAWMTSQSMRTCRSPKAFKSVTVRNERRIRRWIPWVGPLCLPRAASRSVRVWVDRGNMPYSAVTQPDPVLRRKGGTLSSTVAVHRTWVSPNRAMHDPSAYLAMSGSSWMERNTSAARPEGRMSRISLVKSGRNPNPRAPAPSIGGLRSTWCLIDAFKAAPYISGYEYGQALTVRFARVGGPRPPPCRALPAQPPNFFPDPPDLCPDHP